MGRTTELRRELKQRFHPVAEARGFVADPSHAPFGIDFRRTAPDRVDVFDIQWEKYGKPRFAINFGRCPRNGVIHDGQPFLPDQLLSYMGAPHGRLLPRSGATTRSWFRQDRPFLQRRLLRRPDRPARAVVDELLALFPELDAWFESGRLGPHLRFLPALHVGGSKRTQPR